MKRKRGPTNGMYGTPMYMTWARIKSRCFNQNDRSYVHYGARGIYVCDEWANSFLAFVRDMGERPTNKHSIGRINNDGPYCKENCRWETAHEQARNKRNNVWVTSSDGVVCLKDASQAAGVPYKTMHARIAAGWSLDEAMNTPYHWSHIEFNGERMSLQDWARRVGITYKNMHKRLYTHCWPIERALTQPPRTRAHTKQTSPAHI